MRRLQAAPMGIGLLLACFAVTAADEPPVPTIKQLMVDVLTPAANFIRASDDPRSEGDWQDIADAAATAIRALEQIREGGSGANDMTWAIQASWDEHADNAIAAATAAREAASDKDPRRLALARGQLFEPCESCHLDYFPDIDPESIAD